MSRPKLSPQQVAQIREQGLRPGFCMQRCAEEYNVSRWTIGRVLKGRTYAGEREVVFPPRALLLRETKTAYASQDDALVAAKEYLAERGLEFCGWASDATGVDVYVAWTGDKVRLIWVDLK